MTLDERYEELRRESRRANREDRETLELFQGLVKHPGWVRYMELCNTKKQELSDRLLSDGEGGLKGAIDDQRIKGELRGILWTTGIVASTIAELSREFAPEPEAEDE